MATERPEGEDQQTKEEDARDLSQERKSESGSTVEEESEDSFPASDPPSY